WARSAGTLSSAAKNGRWASATGLALDSDGSALISGTFNGQSSTGASITFGAQTLTTQVYNGAGFVVRYAPEGSVTWAKLIDGGAGFSNVGGSQEVLTGGVLYVSGSYGRGAVFGGGEPNQ